MSENTGKATYLAAEMAMSKRDVADDFLGYDFLFSCSAFGACCKS
jgi:hypothetical protein